MSQPQHSVEQDLPPGADDHAVAAWAATEAGRLLLQVREQGLEGRALKDAGDQSAHDLLMRLLAEHRPGDAVLSEEGKDDKARLRSDRVWIVDPLDGTREFSEPPREDWAVHVALWERGADGGDLVAGAVAQPGIDTTFHTGRPPVVPPSSSERPRLVVSRTRPPAFVEAMATSMDAELVPMGSAGAKVMSVIRNLSDAYVHAGGQYEWDSAAPVAVARAAGLFTSRVDGSPLVYNQDDVLLPDLVVCRPELAEPILAFIAEHGTQIEILTGAVDMERRVEDVIARHGLGEQRDAILAVWHDLRPVEEARALLARIRSSGITCVLATNQDSLFSWHFSSGIERLREALAGTGVLP